jgi:electron transfer flavoprotein alpha subunit
VTWPPEVAATARAGLIADCVDIRAGEDGTVVGLCPAWGGEIMAEITYAPGHGTGFATVHPHGATRKEGYPIEKAVRTGGFGGYP